MALSLGDRIIRGVVVAGPEGSGPVRPVYLGQFRVGTTGTNGGHVVPSLTQIEFDHVNQVGHDQKYNFGLIGATGQIRIGEALFIATAIDERYATTVFTGQWTGTNNHLSLLQEGTYEVYGISALDAVAMTSVLSTIIPSTQTISASEANIYRTLSLQATAGLYADVTETTAGDTNSKAVTPRGLHSAWGWLPSIAEADWTDWSTATVSTGVTAIDNLANLSVSNTDSLSSDNRLAIVRTTGWTDTPVVPGYSGFRLGIHFIGGDSATQQYLYAFFGTGGLVLLKKSGQAWIPVEGEDPIYAYYWLDPVSHSGAWRFFRNYQGSSLGTDSPFGANSFLLQEASSGVIRAIQPGYVSGQITLTSRTRSRGGSLGSFTALSDTPAAFRAADAGDYLRVKPTYDGIEFSPLPSASRVTEGVVQYPSETDFLTDRESTTKVFPVADAWKLHNHIRGTKSADYLKIVDADEDAEIGFYSDTNISTGIIDPTPWSSLKSIKIYRRGAAPNQSNRTGFPPGIPLTTVDMKEYFNEAVNFIPSYIQLKHDDSNHAWFRIVSALGQDGYWELVLSHLNNSMFTTAGQIGGDGIIYTVTYLYDRFRPYVQRFSNPEEFATLPGVLDSFGPLATNAVFLPSIRASIIDAAFQRAIQGNNETDDFGSYERTSSSTPSTGQIQINATGNQVNSFVLTPKSGQKDDIQGYSLGDWVNYGGLKTTVNGFASFYQGRITIPVLNRAGTLLSDAPAVGSSGGFLFIGKDTHRGQFVEPVFEENATNLGGKGGTQGQIWTRGSNTTNATWADAPVSLPSQTGQSGKYLTTDGTNASWSTVDSLPSQTGQGGKYLTTDGTTASWDDVSLLNFYDSGTLTNPDDVSNHPDTDAIPMPSMTESGVISTENITGFGTVYKTSALKSIAWDWNVDASLGVAIELHRSTTKPTSSTDAKADTHQVDSVGDGTPGSYTEFDVAANTYWWLAISGGGTRTLTDRSIRVRASYETTQAGNFTNLIAAGGVTGGGVSGSVSFAVDPGDGVELTDSTNSAKLRVKLSGSTLTRSSDGLKVSSGGIGTTELASTSVTGPKIASNAVGQSKIAAGSVTSAKLATNAVDSDALADAAVDTAALADDAVTQAKVADDAIGAAQIADDAVTAAALANNAVESAAIKDSAVGSSALASGAVTHVKIGLDAVEGENIKDDAIGDEHIADNAVLTAAIKDANVTHAKLAEDAVESDNIKAGAIGSTELAAGAVGAAALATGAVTSQKIANNAVTTSAIASDAVTKAKLADDSVGTAELDLANLQGLTGYLLPTGGTSGQVPVRDATGSGVSWGSISGAQNVTLDNLPSIAEGYVYQGKGSTSDIVAAPVVDTIVTTTGTLAHDSGVLLGTDTAGATDPVDFGAIGDATITREALGFGFIYKIEPTHTLDKTGNNRLRIRINCTVNSGVAMVCRYAATAPTTTNLTTHGTQLFNANSVSNSIAADETLPADAAPVYFWFYPTATRTISSRRLRLNANWSQTTNHAGLLPGGQDGQVLSRKATAPFWEWVGVDVNIISDGSLGSVKLDADTDTKKLGFRNLIGKPVVSSVTFAPALTLNANDYDVAELTATGNFTLSGISNLSEGQSLTLAVKQDSTGGHVISFATTGADRPQLNTGAALPVLRTTGGAVDELHFRKIDGKVEYISGGSSSGGGISYTELFNGNVTLSINNAWSNEQTLSEDPTSFSSIYVEWARENTAGVAVMEFRSALWSSFSDVGSGSVSSTSDNHIYMQVGSSIGNTPAYIGRGSSATKFRVAAEHSNGYDPSPLRIYGVR